MAEINIKNLIKNGEKTDVEFKKSKDALNKNIYDKIGRAHV